MKKNYPMKRVFFYTLLIFSVLSCKDKDDVVQGADLSVKDFIWKGLNQYYLWQADVPNLADNRFASSVSKTNFSSTAYVNFLNSYSENEDFFYQMLHKPLRLYENDYIDQFSYITDNYTELEQSFKGVSLSSGMEFTLSRYGQNNGVLGIVTYVIPNTSADNQGVKRGDIFTKIDGTMLDADNYRNLIYNDKTSMTIDINKMERVNNQLTIVPVNQSVTMEKKEITENPIFIKKTFDKGGKKIAYLMYNGFIANFDLELNQVFAEFKSQGVTDLILDLRYNGGGRISSATYLGSMILGSDANGKLFAKERWNHKLQPYFENRGGVDNFFTNTLTTDNNQKAPINHLNMSRIYVLTTRSTASASELVINGLKPYIDVVQIGGNTRGKNVGSITIYDTNNKGERNPNHKWALQPLTFKIENANGFGDYATGLQPTHLLSEDVANLGVLGDENEPFLAKALEIITGNSGRYPEKKVEIPLIPMDNSKTFNIGANGMYK